MKAVLTDINGTTTRADFPRTLGKDMAMHGAEFARQAKGRALELIQDLQAEYGLGSPEEVIAYVNEQLSQRNFNPNYFQLSGMANVYSIEQGDLRGEFFDDVPVAFKAWNKAGKGVFVFSNGSSELTRGLLKTAAQGNLSRYVRACFDTAVVGSKTERDTYLRIMDRIGEEPQDIMSLSDLEEELEAADRAGMQVRLVVRPGNKEIEIPKYRIIRSFEELL